jgi:hypothetical protein
MFQDVCGLKFVGCVAFMLKLYEMMRIFEAPPMPMKFPGAMMVAASA